MRMRFCPHNAARSLLAHVVTVLFPLRAHAAAFRGEGWGLPVVEAMAMELPVIVTNFSGPTAYLSEAVGYPLRYELVDVPSGSGAFSGEEQEACRAQGGPQHGAPPPPWPLRLA